MNDKILNRLIFVLSLLGLAVTSFLLYEYSLSGPVICPVGQGCDIVRASPYSHIFGIPIPILGLFFYLAMVISTIMHSQRLLNRNLNKLQIVASVFAVGFGAYLTYLEAFVIKAYCFWCVISFIISIVILLAVIPFSKKVVFDDKRD